MLLVTDQISSHINFLPAVDKLQILKSRRYENIQQRLGVLVQVSFLLPLCPPHCLLSLICHERVSSSLAFFFSCHLCQELNLDFLKLYLIAALVDLVLVD